MSRELSAAAKAAAKTARIIAAQAVMEAINKRAAIPQTPKIRCPHIYASGKRCTGHIVSVEAYKADLSWTLQDDGSWVFGAGEPRSHYHLFCSEKGNHAGSRRNDSEKMKFYLSDLPAELRAVVDAKRGAK